ncbi:M4 family metallopeptidase [Angustibacter aerolatus]
MVPTGATAASTSGEPGTSPSVRAHTAALADARTRTAAVGRALGLGSGEALQVRDVVSDRDGTTHVRYTRTFDGLRVIGGDLVVHEAKSGAVRGVDRAGSGRVAVTSTTPGVSRSSALAAGREKARYTPTDGAAELVVYAAGAKPVLAYDVVTEGVRADQTPSRLHTVVDATSGRTLASWDEIETGSGRSIYSGTVTIGTTKGASSYSMTDTARGSGTTTNLNHATSGNGTLFTDADDVWGDGTTANAQSAAVDAAYGAQLTWDYYKNTHGRSGIFADGRGVRSRVHYGNNYENAFWDGTQMTYGDGANNADPLTEIDVAGHEMSHGVTEATAGLAYTGDAGGLNEATSDIFGTAVEFSANNSSDVGDYLIGEKIDLNGNGTPLRYMDKPSKDGSTPDCWSTNTKNLDPHYSSGVGNHWFYLASEGSGAKTINGVAYNSPTCNGSTVTGIGRAAAEKIWYRALTTYMTSTTTYTQARDASIRAATDLYGASSTQCTGVQTAWTALSVPAGSYSCSGSGGGTDPTPPTTGNLLANPGFESGATSWTGTSGPITNNTGRPARTGSWKLWLGGNGSTSTENESQTVTVASTAAAPTLSFWLRTDTAESGSTAYDTMKVQVVSGGTTTTLATYSNVNANSTYTQKSFSLSAYKGKSVSVKFLMSEDSSLQTSFVVDDTSVTNG